MKNVKWNFLILSILAAFSIIGIGIFLAERSPFGMIASFLILIVIMGFGFTLKKKMREEGKL